MSELPPIVLVHGLWMTPHSWEAWAQRFRAAGHEVHTPGWPHIGQGQEGIDVIRADPSPLAGLGVTEIADHLETYLEGIGSEPIIMGHSFGGLLTQVLLSRGHGLAGVAIDSAPPKGVLRLPVSTLRASFPILRNPFAKNSVKGLTPKQFHYAFCNTMSAEESQEAWARLHIPGPARPLFQAAFANFNVSSDYPTKVDFAKADRAPLLLIAGERDHIVPPSANRENAGKYRKSGSPAEYREFAGRTHYIVGQDGWEEVADYAMTWAMDAIAG